MSEFSPTTKSNFPRGAQSALTGGPLPLYNCSPAINGSNQRGRGPPVMGGLEHLTEGMVRGGRGGGGGCSIHLEQIEHKAGFSQTL